MIGEPGVGKSSLIGAAAAEAVGRGCTVFWGAGDELSEAFPLVPFLDALDVRTGTDERRASVARLLREVSAVQGADAVYAASEQLLGLIDDLCAEAPVLLCIDDMHWVDTASIGLWHQLARSVAQLPLLLVAATRPVPVRAELEALRRYLRTNRMPVLELSSLQSSAVTAMVSELAGGEPGPRLTAMVEQAGGNPLYVAELIGALARADRLQPQADGRVEAAGATMPTSVTEAIDDRLTGLGPDTHEVLRTASMLGVEFNLPELATATGLPMVKLSGALQDAVHAGVLAEGDHAMMFRHPLIRRALYEKMTPSIRRAWHNDLARTLAQQDSPPAKVIRHLLAATGDPDAGHADGPSGHAPDGWVIDWLLKHGTLAVNQAPDAARPLLATIFRSLSNSDPRRLRIATLLAQTHYLSGRPGEAARVCEEVLPGTGAADDDTAVDLLIAYTSALGDLYRGEDTISRLLERERDRPERGEKGRLRLGMQIARQLYRNARIDRAERTANEVLQAARESGDRPTAAQAAGQLVIHHLERVGDPRGALLLADEAVQLVAGDPAHADVWLRCRANRLGALIELQRLGECEQELRDIQKICERYGNVRMIAQSHYFATQLYFQLGRWDEALVSAEFATEATSYFPNPDSIAMAATIHAHRDNADAVDRCLTKMRAAMNVVAASGWDASDWSRITAAESVALSRAGRPSEAMDAILEAEPNVRPCTGHDISVEGVRLATALGDHELAGRLAAQTGAFWTGKGPSAELDAAYCQAIVDRDPQQLDAIAERYRRLDERWRLAQVQESLAEAWIHHAKPDKARTIIHQALDSYETLGATWDINRIRARFRSLGIRMRNPAAAPKRPDRGWDSLSPTEARIAALVAQGLSNPQIGEQLFLSRRTIQTHVSHILSKLDVRSRVEITRLYVEHTKSGQS